MPFKNSEDKLAYQRAYHLRPEPAIARWKRWGIVPFPFTWEQLWDIYANTKTCNNAKCGRKLTRGRGSTGRTLDHDHDTGFVRAVLCKRCNTTAGHDDNTCWVDRTDSLERNRNDRFRADSNPR